jgi:hypothetical protein
MQPRFYISAETTISTGLHNIASTRLQGQRLVIARAVCVVLVILTLGLFVAMLPAYFTQLQTVCAGSACAASQPTLAAARTLQTLGLSLNNYATFMFILTIIAALACFIVSAVISWRRSDDWMALLVTLTLVMMGTAYITYALLQGHSSWQFPALILNTLTYGGLFLVYSLFPDGRFVPRWVCWFTVGWIAWGTIYTFFSNLPSARMIHNVVWLCELAGIAAALVYRYRQVSGLVQRQQTKWVVFGIVVPIILVICLQVPALLFPSLGLPGSLYNLVSGPGFLFALIPLPLTIGIAILRSRLWDIDIVINRTLVYFLLTVALVLVYVGSVLLLQRLFYTLTGQDSVFAEIASTLASALLFQPLRHRIQVIIDRRFYRHKYDTARAIAAFGAQLRLRKEMDLTTLTGDMLKVVEETMQPEHVSLWLSKPGPRTRDSRRTRHLLL